MGSNRFYFAGAMLIALAILLLLVKLLMFMAWFAAGPIGLAGLILLGIGWITGRRRPDGW
jgi:membrane-bound ClpP family serine protease